MFHFETAGLSDIGNKRDNQEDSFLVDDTHRLYAVADGMGGHLAGEVASTIITETLQTAVSDSEYPLALGPDSKRSPEGDRLDSWIQNANKLVFEQSQNQAECRGMGSTIAALYFTDTRAIVANVGDSPIYLVRAGNIELISTVHNLSADQTAQNLYGQDMLLKQFSHMLTRAVGLGDDVQPYIRELPYCAGDSFIICSDGLSNAVEPEEMLTIVRQCAPMEACRKFIDMANERGGDDNITGIVIKIRD